MAGDWSTLLRSAGVENIFLDHAWLCGWWRAYAEGRELWTLVVAGDEGIEGIAPLMLERAANGSRRLAFMGAGEVVPNHLDLILHPARRGELIGKLVGYLCQHGPQWDILELDCLPEESPSRGLLFEHLRGQGLSVDLKQTSRCPYAALPSTFDEYLGSRGSETRGQLRAKRRRLARDFPEARFGRVERPEELAPVFESLVRLHQARWTRQGRPGSFSNARFIEFHRWVARDGLARGTLRLYFVRVGEAIAAAICCYRVGRRVMYYNAGFDERWARYSLGVQLLAHALERSVAEGASEFDFLKGKESYKDHWATGVRGDWRLRAASPHWRGRLVWARLKTGEAARGWVRRAMPRDVRRAAKRFLPRP